MPGKSIFQKQGLKAWKKSQAKDVKKLKKDVSFIQKTMELKFHDEIPSNTFLTANEVNNVGEIICISNMAGGTAETSRVGNQITLKSIELAGDLTMDASVANTKVRIIYFVDKRHQSITPLSTDLLVTDNILSFKNLKTQKRFTVLKDVKYNLNTYSPTKNVYFKKSWKNGLDVRYKGNSVNDTVKNPVYMYVVSNQSGTAKPSFYCQTRGRYYDL